MRRPASGIGRCAAERVAWQLRRATEGDQAGEVSGVVGGGRRTGLRGAVVAAADRRAAEARSSRSGGDAHQPRDDLPLAVCPVARRAAPPADRAAADRAHAAAAPAGARRRAGGSSAMVSIAERPPEVDDRARPRATGKAICSSAPPASPRSRRWSSARPATSCSPAWAATAPASPSPTRSRAHQALPAHLVKSLTWDQGARTGRPPALHRRRPASRSTSATRTRPGNAAATRTPTGCSASTSHASTDLAEFTQTDLDQIAAELNGRPRKTLDWNTPAEKNGTPVALTA